MPDIRNCRKCGKMYNYIGGNPICPLCKEKDEEDFKRVKEYLYKNHGATIYEVSSVLEISVERIKAYLKDGRLEIINDGNLILECESCGKSIKSGRFCDDCTNHLTKDLVSLSGQMQSTAKPEEPDKNARGKGMRYLHKDDK